MWKFTYSVHFHISSIVRSDHTATVPQPQAPIKGEMKATNLPLYKLPSVTVFTFIFKYHRTLYLK